MRTGFSEAEVTDLERELDVRWRRELMFGYSPHRPT